MNHLKKLLFCYILLMFTVAIAFTQEAKNALLIANSDYPDAIGDLPKPIPEAEALKAALESIGFEITLVKNADKETMVETLQYFKEKTEKAGGIAFFHYGGHAVQVDGINYLLPALTKIENESKVRFRCIELDEVMQSMRGKSNIVILDSCRNNPFGNSRGAGTRGLAALNKKPANSIIIYSADSGQTAQDGVFTPILTKKIIEKDKSIYDVYKEVAEEVIKEAQEKTGSPQKPAVYIQLDKGEDIFLAGQSYSVKALRGNLLITSECAVTLYLEGEKKDFIKEDGSVLIEGLRTGSYTVEVKSDINKFERKVKISADTQTAVNIKTGSIKLISEVSGKLYLNGKYYQDIGSYGNIIFPRLLEGNYDIEVRTESQTFKQEAKVRIGETTAVTVFKPKEVEVKPVSQKTDSYSDDSFYALVFYGSYNLGISPVYKQDGSTSTIKYSSDTTDKNKTANEKPFLDQGFSVGLTWARICVVNFLDCQFFTGYTFYNHSFGNDESITQHEFDALGLKLGMGSKRIKFLFGVRFYCHWEELQYISIRGKEKMTGIACFGIAPGCGLDFALGNYFSIYAEYRSRITISNHTSFKHSCNIGINLNVLKVRI